MKRSKVSRDIAQEQAVWTKADSLAFYRSHRRRPEDMYPSERFFLPALLREVSSCLDIGCAAGGFSAIMKSFNPALRYVGVDITPQFVDMARESYPDSEFYVSDGIGLPFAPNSFELVFSTGIMHVNSRYREIVKSAYAACSKYLLCDFRLTTGPTTVGEFDADLHGTGNTSSTLPYIVLNLDELLGFLKDLQPKPASITARGYPHAPSPSARVDLKEITMAFFLVEKGGGGDRQTRLDIDLSAGTGEGKGLRS